MKNLLAIFPSFESAIGGGVQTTGAVAWEGLLTQYGERLRGLSYGPIPRQQHPQMRYAESKVGAVWSAFREGGAADQLLFWHVDMLKLLPLLRPGRARVILFLHGIEVWRTFDRSTRHLLDRVDLFLCNSEHTWNTFVLNNPAFADHTHRCVPLGVGATTSPPKADSKPAVVMLGRLVRSEDYKGHREVIAAWPNVRDSVPDAELWIIGDGDLRPMLETPTTTAAGVRFFGFLPESEKQRLLAESRCLALPSRNEGFGLVYLEAMRLGKPCLVSSLDAGREVVNPPEAGLAVDPRIQEQLIPALTALLQPGEQARDWAIRSWRRYCDYFTAQHFQQRLIEALA